MAKDLVSAWQRRGGKLLIGADDQDNAPRLQEATARRTQELQQIANGVPTILLTERDSIEFLAGLLAAAAIGAPIVLANPQWVESDWQQIAGLIQPNCVWGDCPIIPSSAAIDIRRGSVMIPTGGSSGQIRLAMHTWRSLTASVRGFQNYFNQSRINSVCVLPLHHVSGLMQFWRGYVTGGTLAIAPFKAVQAGLRPAIDPDTCFLSLVPTQLQRLLDGASDWLQQFHTVLLGGAPAWPELLDRAQAEQIRLAPTYGMTETASQIATLRPEHFLQGRRSCGWVLPHAAVQSDPIEPLQVRARSLCLGYYPNLFPPDAPFVTDDLGYFDEGGELHIAGRSSSKIITGGENVFPAEVEAAIWATSLVKDVCVVGLSDRNWGEVVTAACVLADADSSIEQLQQVVNAKLVPFKRPKRWIVLDALPRNAQGKLNVAQLKTELFDRQTARNC